MLKATLTFIDNKLNVEKGIGQFIDRAVDKSLNLMERNIKAGMHKGWGVDEGHLRRSITNRKTGFGKGEVHTQAVEGGQSINYAAYVEYGTEKMAPRAFMRRGVGQSQNQIKDIFKDEANKVVTKVTKGGKI